MARVSGRGLLFSLLVMLLGPVPAALGDEPATVGPVDRLLLREQSIGAGYFVVSAEGVFGGWEALTIVYDDPVPGGGEPSPRPDGAVVGR